MCRPNPSYNATKSHDQPKNKGSNANDGKISRSSGSNICWNTTTLLGGILAVLIAIFPAFVSESIGGWTAKYTSPRPIFTPNDIPNLHGKVAIVTGANTGIG
jgi:hypothetical protein